METVLKPIIDILGSMPKMSDRITFVLLLFVAFWIVDRGFLFTKQYSDTKRFGEYKELLSYLGSSQSSSAMQVGLPGQMQLPASKPVLDEQTKNEVRDELRKRSSKLIFPPKKLEGLIDTLSNLLYDDTHGSEVVGNRLMYQTYLARKSFLRYKVIEVVNSSIGEKWETSRLKMFSLENMLTSGFWLWIYMLGTLLYLMVEAVNQWQAVTKRKFSDLLVKIGSHLLLFLFFVIFIFAGSIIALAFFTSLIPIIYDPVLNYILNIAICTYFVEALTRVLANFFPGKAKEPIVVT